MPAKRPPKDSNQLAKYILDVTIGKAEKIEPPKRKKDEEPIRKLKTREKGRVKPKLRSS